MSPTKPDPDLRSTEPSAATTNESHPSAPGTFATAAGLGVVASEQVTHHEHDPDAPAVAPGARRPGTTEGRAATAARGGVRGGLGEIEAPPALGQTALNPPTGGTGAPSPGSSGIRATADPNFNTQRADEEGVPSAEAVSEQKASIKRAEQSASQQNRSE